MLNRGFPDRMFPYAGQPTPSTQPVETRTASGSIGEAAHGRVLRMTTAITLSFEGGIRPGFLTTLWNAATPASPAVVTLRAGPGQLIDGLSTYPMYSGEMRTFWVSDVDNNLYSTVVCDGTFIDYTTTGAQTAIWPPGYNFVDVDVIGSGSGGKGGGGGASGTTNNAAGVSGPGGGGGGSGCNGQWGYSRIPYESIVPGTTFAYNNGAGGAGGASGPGGSGAVNAAGATGTNGGNVPVAGNVTTFTYGLYSLSVLGGTIASGGAGTGGNVTGNTPGNGGAANSDNLGASAITSFLTTYKNVNNATAGTAGIAAAGSGLPGAGNGGNGAPSGSPYIVGTAIPAGTGGTRSSVLGVAGGDPATPAQAPPGAGGAGGPGGGGSSGAVGAGTSGRGGNGSAGGLGGNGLTRVQFRR